MEETYYYYTLIDIFQAYSEHPFWDWLKIWDGISDTGASFLSNLKPNDVTNYLLDPLINRWINDKIALYVSTREYSISHWGSNIERENAMAPILKKLNLIIPKYKELYTRYNAMLTAIDAGLSNEATTTSINRHNDTPNANSDYSADKYTSDISQNTTTSKQTNNALDDYDIIRSRIEILPQQIINEMKEFEIWI